MSLASKISADKTALRNQMRARLKTLGTGREEGSALILDRILNHSAWAVASTVAVFAPLPQEPDLLGLLAHPGKRFVFPCVEGDGLLWRTAATREALQPVARPVGRLAEPVDGEWIDPSAIDCLIVPGLAFTRCGKRLGRGGGFYDRTLASVRSGAKALGVCFSIQLVETLPAEPHDRSVHEVLHA
jgi:5-formyltetrahydrofolate cyclo-ligase